MSESDAVSYYIKSIEDILKRESPAEKTAAIIFEPIQGEGGFIPAPIEWVKAVREICNKQKIIMISDEVQTGFARSGKMFASDYYREEGCLPDMMTVAKALGGGMPLSAVIGSAEVMDNVTPGTIGGTYGGNPIACASGIATIKVMEQEDYPKMALDIGQKCMSRFSEWKDKYEVIGDCRGIGAMIAIEFVKSKETKEPDSDIVKKIINVSLNRGLLILNAGVYGNVIRMLSPLNITNEQIDIGLDILEDAIKDCI